MAPAEAPPTTIPPPHVANGETKEEFVYDSQHRLIRKVDPLGFLERTLYNDAYLNSYGQKVLQQIHIDPLGLETIETFNPRGQSSCIEKKKNGNTLLIEEKFPNKNGLLSFQIDTISSPQGERKINTRWSYDERGRLTTLTEADGTLDAKITQHAYTLRGELAKTTKPDGTVLSYQYNELGHPTSLTSSDSTVSHQMVYNRLGHLIQSDRVSRNLDPGGRILSETTTQGFSIKNNYDALGRKVECVIPEANCLIEYDYNPAYLKNVQRKILDRTMLYSHAYTSRDLAGNLLSEESILNQGQVQYSIDPLSRKTAISSPYFTQQVHEYDPVGNILRMQIQNKTYLHLRRPLPTHFRIYPYLSLRYPLQSPPERR